MSRLLLSLPLALALSVVVNPGRPAHEVPVRYAARAPSPFGAIPTAFKPDRDDAALAGRLKIAAAGRTPPASGPVLEAQNTAGSPGQPARDTESSGAAPGTKRDEIRFGIVAPFSGPSKELGRQMRVGIETAFDAANDAGTIKGHRLRLVAADDGYEPNRTGEAMKQLVEQNDVLGTIGNVGTPTAAVSLPYALEHKRLFFTALSGANLLRAVPPDHYVFNYRPSYAEETEATVKYLVAVRGIRPQEIAVFAQRDTYGDAGYSGVTRALRAAGQGSAQPLLLTYARNTVDVDEAVAKLRSKRPAIKAVIMVATYRAAAKFIEKTRLAHPAMIYTNVSFVGSTALADELMLLGPRYAEGVIVTQVVPDVTGYSKAVLDYRAALARYFPGEAPDYISFEGYVDAKLLIDGLRRAGDDLAVETVINGLEAIHDGDLGLGTIITFSPSEHQGSHKIWATQLDASGRYKPIDFE